MVKTPITEAWVENINYELIPDDGENNEWQIRIKTGDFVECVIRYGSIRFGDDGVVTFDYSLIYSPDPDLKENDPDLQKAVSHILHSVIVTALEAAEQYERRT